MLIDRYKGVGYYILCFVYRVLKAQLERIITIKYTDVRLRKY